MRLKASVSNGHRGDRRGLRLAAGRPIAATADVPRTYDRPTIAAHWIVAFGVAFQWVGAQLVDRFAAGPPRIDARSVHIVTGASLLGLVLWRLWWRSRRGVRFDPDPRPLLAAAAQVAHAALYALLVATLCLGVTDAWVRGDSLFGLLHVPKMGGLAPAARHALDKQIVAVHRLSANALLCLAGLHAAAALAHHLWLKDEVLGRMIGLLARKR
jgi:cytochrome b561